MEGRTVLPVLARVWWEAWVLGSSEGTFNTRRQTVRYQVFTSKLSGFTPTLTPKLDVQQRPMSPHVGVRSSIFLLNGRSFIRCILL